MTRKETEDISRERVALERRLHKIQRPDFTLNSCNLVAVCYKVIELFNRITFGFI